MSSRFRIQRDGYQREINIDSNGIATGRDIPGARRSILERNKALQNQSDAVKTQSFGKLALDIPIEDYRVLLKMWPGLHPSHPDHKFEMRRFLKSPASAPYRVTRASRTNAGHIQVK